MAQLRVAKLKFVRGYDSLSEPLPECVSDEHSRFHRLKSVPDNRQATRSRLTADGVHAQVHPVEEDTHRFGTDPDHSGGRNRLEERKQFAKRVAGSSNFVSTFKADVGSNG